MRFGDLTYLEISKRAEDGWLAIVPTGCTEQQGPHLPVDFDTYFVETVALAASERAVQDYDVHSLVLPAMPFGPTPEHRNYGSGYIDIPVELHDALLDAVLRSLVEQGFKRIVVWQGCGQHDLNGVVDHNETHKGRARAFLPPLPYQEIWCRVADSSVPGGHADSFTTSISLHLRPEGVRTDLISDPQHEPVDWEDPNLDFADYSATGVIGDPTHASAALGAELWQASVETIAAIFKTVVDEPNV